MHGVETSLFDQAKGMSLLQSEIEIFNDVKLIREPMWLRRSEFRIEKVHSSVKIGFRSKEMFDKMIKKGVIVSGKILKTSEFLNTKPTDQCIKCQKFGHFSTTCKRQFWTCNFCAGNHETRLHSCSICKSKESCPHLPPKCVNCNGAHKSNDQNCEHFRSLLTKTRNTIEDQL